MTDQYLRRLIRHYAISRSSDDAVVLANAILRSHGVRAHKPSHAEAKAEIEAMFRAFQLAFSEFISNFPPEAGHHWDLCSNGKLHQYTSSGIMEAGEEE